MNKSLDMKKIEASLRESYLVNKSRFGSLYIECVEKGVSVRVSDHETGRAYELGITSDWKANFLTEEFETEDELINEVKSFFASYKSSAKPAPTAKFSVGEKVRSVYSGLSGEIIFSGKTIYEGWYSGKTEEGYAVKIIDSLGTVHTVPYGELNSAYVKA